jgi:Ca-activated chloride channel family protein
LDATFPSKASRRRACAAFGAVLFWGALLPALPAGSAQEGTPQFKTGVQLVEVFASVTDGRGAPLQGLQASDFQVLEDGVPQPVSVFAAGAFPLTVALGIDHSFSMTGEPLRQAKQASRAFLAQLRPEDRAMVVSINARAEVVSPLSTDRDEQARAVAALSPWSTTALLDALITTLDRLEGEPGRLSVIVFSDGMDRYSQASASQVLERASRSSALVYPITIGRSQPSVMLQVADASGGRAFTLESMKGLESTLATIANELRHQYLLGYVPLRPPTPDEKGWRSIRVRLTTPKPGIQVRARERYRVN